MIFCLGDGADTFEFRAGDGNDTIGAIDMDALTTATRAADIAFIASDFTTGVDKIQYSLVQISQGRSYLTSLAKARIGFGQKPKQALLDQ